MSKSKKMKIDFSDERLISIASDMVDEENYLGALKMLNKNAEITGNDEYSYMLYAEIFDDIGLYDKSAHFWFKYLDSTDDEYEDLADCYEGLAISYLNRGDRKTAGYYYDKLMSVTQDIDPETKKFILKEFMSADENPLKVVYPPEEADVSDVFKAGLRLMNKGDFNGAKKKLCEVDEKNPSYREAMDYAVLCALAVKDYDEGIRLCNEVLRVYPNDIQAYSTFVAVKSEAGDKEGATEICQKMLKLPITSTDDIYRVATACCECKLPKEAYDRLSTVEGEFKYDLNLMFYRAIAAYNAGLIKESLAVFDDIYTVYPDAVTARFWGKKVKDSENETEREEINYFYGVTPEEMEKTMQLLAAFSRLSGKNMKKLYEELNIMSAIKWCFEEPNLTFNTEMHEIAGAIAVEIREDDFIRDLLLNPLLGEETKTSLLMMLAMRNEDNAFGVVIKNKYYRIPTTQLYVGKKARSRFIGAYAKLLGAFASVEDLNPDVFARTAEKLYGELEREGKLKAANDENALAAAIFVKTDARRKDLAKLDIYSKFGTTKEQVDKILG